MKNLFVILIIAVIGSTTLPSCHKADTPEPTAESNFTWHYDGTKFVAKQVTAKLTGIGAPAIRAGMQEGFDPGSGPRINLSSFNQGTYTIGSSGVTYFDYIDVSGDPYPGISGSITITKNANNLFSGNFSATLNNNKTLTGEFINIPIKP